MQSISQRESVNGDYIYISGVVIWEWLEASVKSPSTLLHLFWGMAKL